MLDQIELSPEALAGKQAVGEQLQQFQAQMWQLSREVPEAKQAELMDAVAESMKEAANQVRDRMHSVAPATHTLQLHNS